MEADNEKILANATAQEDDKKKLSKGQKKKAKKKDVGKKPTSKAQQEADDDDEEEEVKTNQAEVKPEIVPAKTETGPAKDVKETSGEAISEPSESKPKEEGTEAADEKVLSKEDKKKDKKKEKKEAKKEAEKKEVKKEPAGKKEASKPLSKVAKLAQERLKQKEEEDRRIKEEEERLKREEEERIRREEEERNRIEEEKRRIKEEKERKIKELKDKGEYLTPAERKKKEQEEIRRQQFLAANSLNNQTNKDTPANVENKPKKKFKKESDLLSQLGKINLDKEKPEEEKLNKEADNKKLSEDLDWEKEEVLKEASDETDKQIGGEEKPEKGRKGKGKDSKIEEAKNDETVDKKTEKKEKKKDDKKDEKKDEKKKEEPSLNPFSVSDSSEFRSPICCILGHVDTGKTTLLDKIRNTNVQEGEAGGITQQIGATFFPVSKINEETQKISSFYPVDVNVPGLLIIDTPGHESFSNLRSRGSGLCDIAILVIDLMHGLENQTLESIELLKMRKTPFVIALNKIDRLYSWKTEKNGSSKLSLDRQKGNVGDEFDKKFKGIVTQMAEKGFNTALYWENQEIKTHVSFVPTSGVTGEGIPDLLGVILKYTQIFLKNKIKLKKDEFSCTVLEVKMIEGLGTTIDVVLVNGTIREGDRIVLMGFEGPIITDIRALLTPHPMKEMRVKNEYIHHKFLHASMGIKICATGLENAVAGSQLFVANNEEEEETYKTELEKDLDSVRKKIELSVQGVCVAASTLGSLEALLQFLKTSKIPVAYIRIGPVSKDDVMKALKSVLAEDPSKRKKEFACVLAFDVKIFQEAQQFADANGIKIFTANIIYHLFDQFTLHVSQIREERKREEGKDAVFPCVLKPVAFFHLKDPILIGVDVLKGVLKLNTPVCVLDKEKTRIGVVESIESNKKPMREARAETGSVAIKIKTNNDTLMAGRHFNLEDKLASILTRNSIDLLKEYYRDEMSKPDWDLVRELKTVFGIF